MRTWIEPYHASARAGAAEVVSEEAGQKVSRIISTAIYWYATPPRWEGTGIEGWADGLTRS